MCYKIRLLPKIWAVFFLFSFYFSDAQTHNIVVNDIYGMPINNLSVKINNNIFFTKDGLINYDGLIKKIEIDDKNYYFYDEDIEKDGLYLIKLEKIIKIEEVKLSKKDTIINYYKPQREKLSFVCGFENKNLAVLNYFKLHKRTKLKNYSFFIMSEKKFCAPFNFVIYKKNEEQLLKILTLKINNYNKNNNTIDLSYMNMILEGGDYYFGMEWIIDKAKTLYIKKMHNKETYGQDLGGSIKEISTSKTYFYKDFELIYLKSKSFQQLKFSR